jgi:hypothetical protein
VITTLEEVAMQAISNSTRWAFNVATLNDLRWQPEKSSWTRAYEQRVYWGTVELHQKIANGEGNAVDPAEPVSAQMLREIVKVA